jgi:DNA-binding LacI/PurR family transcriptional regulator
MSPAIGTPPEDMQLAEDNGMPAILVARSMDGSDLPTFRGDDSYGISLATNHLIGLGHRSIAMIGGTDQTSTGRDRYQGYVNALRKAEIEVDPDLRIPGPRSMQGGFEAAVHFLSLPQKPTAAVCWNDLVAIGLMNGIARAGLVPGADISVTGYDDLEEASISMPALTTVWNGQAKSAGWRPARCSIVWPAATNPTASISSSPRCASVSRPALPRRRRAMPWPIWWWTISLLGSKPAPR